jgi:Fe-S-cluster containining protein
MKKKERRRTRRALKTNEQNLDCKHCGLCCTNIRIGLEAEGELAEFLPIYLGYDPGKIDIHFRQRCVQLDDNNFCKIYSNRPMLCRKHDCKRI